MQQFLRIFLDIVLWRRGPQDLPVSGLLLALTAAAYVAVSVAQLALLGESPATWLFFVLVDPLLLAAWTWLVLRIYGRTERFPQTATAVFGTSALLGVRRCTCRSRSCSPRVGAGPDSGLAQVLALLLVVAFALVTGRILKLATETNLITGIAIALTYFLLVNLLVGLTARNGGLSMHLHIVGIAGTFMGGIAALARAAGHRVTGSDRNVYPPMSTQLEALGIDLIEGYSPDQLALEPDVFVIGNVMSRGNPLVEAILDSGRRYESGPEWLARNVLADRWVLGVAGTHGKTTTSSLLAWILEHAGLEPGFLIGGVPLDFGVSARLGGGRHFVVEADEYDTAFFDKRAKFVHYRPRTAILNNLEHDHADIYPDVAAIQRQFHLLLRTRARQRPAGGECRGPQPRRSARDGLLDAGRALHGRRVRADRLARRRRPGLGLRALHGPARRAAGRRGGVEHARPSQRRERARRVRRGVPRRRGRAGGARGAAALRRRAPPTRTARHRGRRRGLRRLRAPPDRDRDHARGRAPHRGQAAA